jgi:CheY-like chemotaxis protein
LDATEATDERGTLPISSAARPRVLIVDDDERFAYALMSLLEAEGFYVVRRAVNGVQAVELAKELRPDAVTMDVDMPVMDGLEATRQIAPLGIAIVIVSASEYQGSITATAMSAGAVANVPKRDASRHLVTVLREVIARAQR